jgi:CheY-like chemotaxis protein/HPt (histidine-containing phosphotransfer) domain-containing protein
MSHKVEEKGLKFQKEMGEGISPVLIGDPYRLNQVLLNLLSNAVKFTEKGSVTVGCHLIKTISNRQSICISVKDTGIGMDEEFSAKLFQKFSQEEKSTTRKYGGTGLGMSISKQLVELMGGSITVKSKKGEGTEITLNIPFTIGAEKDLPAENRQTIDSSILKNKKVLLVEDNVMNRLVANTVLKQYGVIISEAHNGEEAVNAMRQSSFDIVLMDVQMPVMDGLTATRFIRKEVNQDIPIIALTANAIKGESDRCIEAGMNDFVSKPFEEEDLVYAMTKWISNNNEQKNGTMKNNGETKQPLYDLSKLEKIANGDKGFVNEMVRLFKDQVPADVNQIKAAYSRNDFTTVKEIAHRIKPAIDNMGIASLHQEIRKIESVALNEPHSPELPELIKELETVIGLVVGELS